MNEHIVKKRGKFRKARLMAEAVASGGKNIGARDAYRILTDLKAKAKNTSFMVRECTA